MMVSSSGLVGVNLGVGFSKPVADWSAAVIVSSHVIGSFRPRFLVCSPPFSGRTSLVLPSFTEFRSDFGEFYRVLWVFTGFYRVLPGLFVLTWFYWIEMGLYLVLPSFTEFRSDFVRFTESCGFLPGFTGFYLVSLC